MTDTLHWLIPLCGSSVLCGSEGRRECPLRLNLLASPAGHSPGQWQCNAAPQPIRLREGCRANRVTAGQCNACVVAGVEEGGGGFNEELLFFSM